MFRVFKRLDRVLADPRTDEALHAEDNAVPHAVVMIVKRLRAGNAALQAAIQENAIPAMYRATTALAEAGDALRAMRAERDALNDAHQAMTRTIAALVLQLGGDVTITTENMDKANVISSQRNVDGSITLRSSS